MGIASTRQSSVIVGGWSLIAATVLFAAVFGYLASTFDYPAVLDNSAADVLPRLLALGGTGRAVWVIYGLIPLLLVPTGRGVAAAARIAAPHPGTLALWLAVFTDSFLSPRSPSPRLPRIDAGSSTRGAGQRAWISRDAAQSHTARHAGRSRQ